MKDEMILIVLLSALQVTTGVPLIDEEEAALAEYELEYQLSTALMIYSGKQDMVTFFKVNNWKDIATKSQDPVCSQTVHDMIKVYHAVDPNKAMKDLTQVGKLIQLAYGSSKGFSCSTYILEVLSNYQSLVKNSFLTTSVFTAHSMKSLRYHSKAIYFANRYRETMNEKYATFSLKFLSFSSKIAGKMAEESQKLVKESDALMKMSELALYGANDDSVATGIEKKKLQERMKEVKSDRAKYEQKQKDLKNNVEAQRQEEEKLAGLIDGNIVGGIIGKISTREKQDNDCSNVQCHDHATCTHISGTHSCKCHKGYSGDGRNCKKKIREYELVCATGECAVGEGDCDYDSECQKGLTCENSNCHWDPFRGRSGHSDCCKDPKADIHVGQWGKWSEWSICSKLCGGTQQRKRVCKNGMFEDNCHKGEPIDTRNCNENECENTRKRAKEIRLNRIKHQEDLMENNAKLAKQVSQLNSHTETETTLTTAIKGLEITISTMGRIKTIFADATLFWKGMERSAKQLQTMLNPKHFQMYIEEFDMYEEEVVKSGYSWLAFAKICLDSALTMKEASKGVDAIMNNIPDHKEAVELVKNLSKEMIAELLEDAKQIRKNIKEMENKSTAAPATTAAPVMLFDLVKLY